MKNLRDKDLFELAKNEIKKGISKDRITAQGFGPDRPIDSNDTRDGRQKNRRVEVKLK